MVFYICFSTSYLSFSDALGNVFSLEIILYWMLPSFYIVVFNCLTYYVLSIVLHKLSQNLPFVHVGGLLPQHSG